MNWKWNMARRVCGGLFVCYCLLMIYLLFVQRQPSALPYGEFLKSAYNLIPFRTIRQQLALLQDPWEGRFAWINLVGNVVMFLPLGLLPVIWRPQKRFGTFFLTVAAVIVLVEAMQLLTTLGSADIDDWIFNMAGACIGYGIWRTLARFFRL